MYLPSGMAHQLSNPDFISLLDDKENSILVIEDADEALMARGTGGCNAAVSTLLNLTDGLLSDVLGLKIICTFNTDIRNLDKALLRPGRLFGKYEFKELTIEKAQELSNKLGRNELITNQMTLAEVYNTDTTETHELHFQNQKMEFK